MTGAELITAERQRQITVEHWTPEHDDEHTEGQLVQAAACYADLAAYQAAVGHSDFKMRMPMGWPWSIDWWKPSVYPERNLVKAGALLCAELDRLRRAKDKGHVPANAK